MILDAIFAIFETVANAVLALIPDIPAPDLSGWADVIAPVWAHAAWLNKYVPLDQAVIMLGVLVVAWIVLYGIRFTVWVLTKLHALGGS